MRSPMTMLALVVAAVVLVVLGVAFQLGMVFPKHHTLSNHAILAWVLAVACLVGASFARPQKT
ncbi:MAG TPA: hypothetical protein VGR61_09460 [Candidatus Dormibacteraeota bacterium]|nr:hypothetical protein [Candidatus Dormibacteraeota bacterium]